MAKTKKTIEQNILEEYLENDSTESSIAIVAPQVGEVIYFEGEDYKVVDILELTQQWHIKNINQPFNSKLITYEDLLRNS